MSTSETTTNIEQEGTAQEIPQYNIWMILFMFIWPAAWFMFLIHIVSPLIWNPQTGAGEYIPTWLFFTIASLGNAAELVVALVLLRREGYPLTLRGLRDRARLRWPKGWKKWALSIALMVVAFLLVMQTGPINKALASTPGFIPMEGWPPAQNPNSEIASAHDAFPDVTLAGNWIFFIVQFVVVGLIFNIIGEELYYRSFLLPKMRAVFGRWDWVVNGVLFTLKHIYTRWMYFGILPTSLVLAFIGGPIGSVYLAMIFHYLGNYMMHLIALVPIIFGGG
jgi:membrane protease YdiL (CAAX protease family)